VTFNISNAVLAIEPKRDGEGRRVKTWQPILLPTSKVRKEFCNFFLGWILRTPVLEAKFVRPMTNLYSDSAHKVVGANYNS